MKMRNIYKCVFRENCLTWSIHKRGRSFTVDNKNDFISIVYWVEHKLRLNWISPRKGILSRGIQQIKSVDSIRFESYWIDLIFHRTVLVSTLISKFESEAMETRKNTFCRTLIMQYVYVNFILKRFVLDGMSNVRVVQ